MLACMDVLDDQIKYNAKIKAITPLVTHCKVRIKFSYILVPIILTYNGKAFSKTIAWLKVIPLFCVFFSFFLFFFHRSFKVLQLTFVQLLLIF